MRLEVDTSVAFERLEHEEGFEPVGVVGQQRVVAQGPNRGDRPKPNRGAGRSYF